MSWQLVQNRYILKGNFCIKPTLMSYILSQTGTLISIQKINSFLTFESYVHDLTWYLFESIGSVPNEIWRQENQVFQLRNELKVRIFSQYFQIHSFCRLTYVMCTLSSVRRTKTLWVYTSISKVPKTHLVLFGKHWKCSRWNLVRKIKIFCKKMS